MYLFTYVHAYLVCNVKVVSCWVKVPRVQECVHWDIQSHRWVSEGNQIVASNATHSTCHFSYLSTYAVIRAQVWPLYLYHPNPKCIFNIYLAPMNFEFV